MISIYSKPGIDMDTIFPYLEDGLPGLVSG